MYVPIMYLSASNYDCTVQWADCDVLWECLLCIIDMGVIEIVTHISTLVVWKKLTNKLIPR